MVRRGHKWQSITLFTGALVLCAAAAGRGQFTSSSDRRMSMLEGNWQSGIGSASAEALRRHEGEELEIGEIISLLREVRYP